MLWETFLIAQREIRRNVMRSALTILGIVIGVAAVIIMVTLGKGATAKVTDGISKMGSNMLNVRPGQGFPGPGGARSSAKSFTLEDVDAIYNNIGGIAAIAPTAGASGQAIFGNNNWSASVNGSTNDLFTVQGWQLNEGRFFNDNELMVGKTVCLVGQTVLDELFRKQASEAVGSAIRIGNIAFTVIGTLKEKGQTGFGHDQDDTIIIPLKTLQRRMAGNNDVESIMISVAKGVPIDTVKTQIEELLRKRRKITGAKEDDFHVQDMTELINTLTSTTTILTSLLGAVAGVSLLVGGIGIMNIMLVSVTERTREIGTRLAIGALAKDVMLQFLVEAVVLSSFGGIFGIIIGLSTAAIAAHFLSVPFVFFPGIVVVAFIFSCLIGILFGYFPARKAAHLNPIDALRYE
ncbi:MAG: ABC transporter permease [Desulfobacteraceae bacterium]|jgi:putative ABC transport system permease protein